MMDVNVEEQSMVAHLELLMKLFYLLPYEYNDQRQIAREQNHCNEEMDFTSLLSSASR